MAILAILALAFLTGALALRSEAADAASPIIQNSQGQSATFEQFGNFGDDCTYTYAYVSVNASQSVSTASGGPATVANQTVLNGYASETNYCTGRYREAYWENVPLAPAQFRMDNALNQAILSGTIPATYGDGCDANWNCDGTPGSATFNVTWNRVGDQLVTPSHDTSHSSGQDIVNIQSSGLGYAAQANGSIVLGGVGGGPVPVTANDADNYQDYGYLSGNMSVNVTVLRPQSIALHPGETLTFHNAVMGACDPLTWGYQLDNGTNITAGSKTTGACTSVGTDDFTIGPFAKNTTVRVWVRDDSAQYCAGYPASYTFYSDGLHALVTGSNPYQVDIMDSGVGCNVPADQMRVPAGPGQGNFDVQLIISKT